MARQIIIRTWCDLHLVEGEQIEGEEIPPLALVPGKPRILALCEVHKKEIYQPLVDALTELGQPVDEGPSKSTGPKKRGPQGGDFACPVAGCPYPGGPTHSALQTHVREHHNTTLAELEGLPAAYVCPECGRGFTTPQGIGVHRTRSHGVEGKAATTERVKPITGTDEQPQLDIERLPYICEDCGRGFGTQNGLNGHRGTHASATSDAVDLTCPECGRHFIAATGLGAHRRAKHGVKGESATARRSREGD